MNMIRIGVLAPKLKRKRKSKKVSHADVVEYNSRQVMKCIETRRRWNATDAKAEPGGIRHATTLARVEVATQKLPRLELIAYMAMEHGTQREQNMLVDKMEEIIGRAAVTESWVYYDSSGDNIRLLASIVVEEWLHPAKFWRESKNEHDPEPKPIIGSFASVMKCDRKTWHVRWKQYFNRFQGHPDRWYKPASEKIENEF